MEVEEGKEEEEENETVVIGESPLTKLPEPDSCEKTSIIHSKRNVPSHLAQVNSACSIDILKVWF